MVEAENENDENFEGRIAETIGESFDTPRRSDLYNSRVAVVRKLNE